MYRSKQFTLLFSSHLAILDSTEHLRFTKTRADTYFHHLMVSLETSMNREGTWTYFYFILTKAKYLILLMVITLNSGASVLHCISATNGDIG